MDRKTLLAVVISVVIIVAGMLITPLLAPPKPVAAPASSPAAPQVSAQPQQPAAANSASTGQAAGTQATAQTTGTAPAAVAAAGKVVPLPGSAPPASQGDTLVRETDLYILTFAANGATLSSAKLKKYKNVDGSPVEMLLTAPGRHDR